MNYVNTRPRVSRSRIHDTANRRSAKHGHRSSPWRAQPCAHSPRHARSTSLPLALLPGALDE